MNLIYSRSKLLYRIHQENKNPEKFSGFISIATAFLFSYFIIDRTIGIKITSTVQPAICSVI